MTLEGGGLTLVRDFPGSANPDSSWTSYSIPLTDSGGWVDSATGTAPTAEMLRSVLQSLTALKIRGQYRAGSGQVWLDNVIMATGSDVQVQIGAPSSTVTSRGPVSFRVTYTGASSITLSASDVILNKTGTVNAPVYVLGGLGYRTVVLNGITGDGTLGISVKAGTATGQLPALGAGPSATFIVDNTAPTAVTVTDEGEMTPSLTSLSAAWTASADAGGSGLAGYLYCIGSSVGALDVKPWTTLGDITSVADDELSLVDGGRYYVSVAAKDAAGNTSAARFSDGILVAPGAGRIGSARSRADGEPLSLRGKTVVAAAQGTFWLEEDDRSAAVKVLSSTAVPPGTRVDVAGVQGISEGQRVLFGHLCKDAGAGASVVPVSMRVRDIGGARWNAATPGVAGGVALYNVGLFVRCFGNVSARDTSVRGDHFFILQEGDASVRVSCGGDIPPPAGSFVEVRGVVDTAQTPEGTVPVLMMAGPGCGVSLIAP